jgi:hypothetical protein
VIRCSGPCDTHNPPHYESCVSMPQDDKESDQTLDSTSGFHDRHPYRIADIDNAARTLFDMKVAVTH